MCEGVTAVTVENGGTDSMETKGRLHLQQEVREKKRQSTIVTFQLCTMNIIRTHTHFFSCMSLLGTLILTGKPLT